MLSFLLVPLPPTSPPRSLACFPAIDIRFTLAFGFLFLSRGAPVSLLFLLSLSLALIHFQSSRAFVSLALTLEARAPRSLQLFHNTLPVRFCRRPTPSHMFGATPPTIHLFLSSSFRILNSKFLHFLFYIRAVFLFYINLLFDLN